MQRREKEEKGREQMSALIAQLLQSGGETAVDTVNTLSSQFARDS